MLKNGPQSGKYGIAVLNVAFFPSFLISSSIFFFSSSTLISLSILISLYLCISTYLMSITFTCTRMLITAPIMRAIEDEKARGRLFVRFDSAPSYEFHDPIKDDDQHEEQTNILKYMYAGDIGGAISSALRQAGMPRQLCDASACCDLSRSSASCDAAASLRCSSAALNLLIFLLGGCRWVRRDARGASSAGSGGLARQRERDAKGLLRCVREDLIHLRLVARLEGLPCGGGVLVPGVEHVDHLCKLADLFA